jgi:hypothetical protein
MNLSRLRCAWNECVTSLTKVPQYLQKDEEKEEADSPKNVRNLHQLSFKLS